MTGPFKKSLTDFLAQPRPPDTATGSIPSKQEQRRGYRLGAASSCTSGTE